MKSLLLVAALLLSNNVFAGCAIANDKNSYGTACSTLSKKDAEDKAVVECQKSGGKDCMTLAHFESGCWAIAKDRTLGISAYAFGKATVEEAKAESITSCLSHGGKNCVNTPNVGCESNITSPNEGGQNKSKYKKI